MHKSSLSPTGTAALALLLVIAINTGAAPTASAHGGHEHHPPARSNAAVWQRAHHVDNFNYLSLIGSSAGGVAGRAYSRLVLADGSLQRSLERSDGVLLSLHTVPASDASLLELEWPDNGPQQHVVDQHAEDRMPLVVDFQPALAFSARVRNGRLTSFTAVQAAAVTSSHRRFASTFDCAFDGAESTPATPGMYLQAVPYLGSASPDLTVHDRSTPISQLFDRPFAFVPAQDTMQGACLTGTAICVEAGRPLIVQSSTTSFAVNAYRLQP